MSQLPRLVITMGDPAGIGSEVILKALANFPALQQITVVGSQDWLAYTYDRLLKNGNLTKDDLVNPANLSILDVPLDSKCEFGNGNAASGAVSFACLEKAIALTLAGEFQGIVTAPIAKYLWQAAGHDYPGQTEVLAEKAGVKRFGMLFVARSPHTGFMLRTLLATTHIPLSQVPASLTPELMSLKLDLLLECLQNDFGIDAPTIAIAGLNPHSGEAGQLGKEEKDWLANWLERAQKQHPQAKLIGLIPPDTMWVKPGQAWFGNANSQLHIADGYLALYHDQGLIPVKLMAFDQAINTTIGLPFIRTSPDHGTAFDIAGKGIADANSMKAAIDLGMEISLIRAKSISH
ncbi:MAG: 4-hydroxythreonine-4-phosphate dehydrogenase PdxA [Pleurocapsa sp.]